MSVPEFPGNIEISPLVPQFIPTSDKASDVMLKLLDLQPGEVLLEPGSGDGRNLIKAAQKYGCRGIGYEISPVLVKESRQKIKAAGLEGKVEIIHGNYLDADFSIANGMFIYLYPRDMARIEEKLSREAKKTVKIVANTFTFSGLKADKVDKSTEYSIYYYEFDPNRHGTRG